METNIDERLDRLNDAVCAYFAGDIRMGEVSDYACWFEPTADTREHKKKKYYMLDNENEYFVPAELPANCDPSALGLFEKNSITPSELKNELDRLTCHHPDCCESHPCRAAKRRSGGLMCCSVLTDTQFGDRVCPFYKTDKAYKKEYLKTISKPRPNIKKHWLEKLIIKPYKG